MADRQILTVVIVNEAKKKIAVTLTSKISEIIESVSSKSGVKDFRRFSLCEVVEDEHGAVIDRFLDVSKTVEEEGIDSKSELVFKLQFVKTNASSAEPDLAADEILFAQIQTNIVREVYPCPEKQAVLLASLEIQAKFGDYNARKHRVGYFNKIGLSAYLPKTVSRHDYAYWQERLFALHLRHKGMSRKEAQHAYIEVAKSISYYGMTFFDLKEEADMELLGGVAEDGLFLFRASNLRLEYKLTFVSLISWVGVEDGIEITHLENGEVQTLSLELSGIKLTQMLNLLDGYYALLPESMKRSDQSPNNEIPTILPTSDMYDSPVTREFLGRFRSRLEYLKGYYMESCMLSKLLPVREFCQQIDHAIDNNLSLMTIDLSETEVVIEDIAIEYISKAISKTIEYMPEKGYNWLENLDVQELDLSYNEISFIGLSVLYNLFRFAENIKVLNLSHYQLENKGALVLAPLLGKLQRLEKLILNECNLGNKGLIALLDSASSANRKGFSEVIAQNNRITERSILGFVAKYLEEEACTLQVLDLSGNKIEQKGLDALLRAVENNKSLELLDISSNHAIGKTLAARIGTTLTNNGTLHSLVCMENKLAGTGILGIVGKAMMSNFSIRVLNLSKNGLANVEEQDVQVFCGTLSEETCSLEEILLTDNSLGPVFGAYLANALKDNSSVKVLHLENNMLGGPVGSLPYGWKEMLATNKTLKELHLTQNNFMEVGFSELFQALEENESVTEIVLDHNHMAHEGLAALESLLSLEDCHIQFLSLNSDKVTDDLLTGKIMEGLKINKSVEKLQLRNNDLTRIGVDKFIDCMKQNPDSFAALRELDLRGNKNLCINEKADRFFLLEKFENDTKLKTVHV